MGKTKAYQTALEELTRQQNDIAILQSSPPTTSLASSSTVSSKNQKSIPSDLDLNNVYNPKYSVIELISTRRRPRKQTVPPRPPNSFFLFKNCYMLELRKLGYRYCMPDVCRQSKQIWTKIPAEVKERYDILALQAVILHQEMYPGYRFQPKKRQIFRPHVFPDNVVVDSSMLNTFTVTNFLGDTNESNETNETINKNDIDTNDSIDLESNPKSLNSPNTPSETSSQSSTPTMSTSDMLELESPAFSDASLSPNMLSPEIPFEIPADCIYLLDPLNSLSNVYPVYPPQTVDHSQFLYGEDIASYSDQQYFL